MSPHHVRGTESPAHCGFFYIGKHAARRIQPADRIRRIRYFCLEHLKRNDVSAAPGGEIGRLIVVAPPVRRASSMERASPQWRGLARSNNRASMGRLLDTFPSSSGVDAATHRIPPATISQSRVGSTRDHRCTILMTERLNAPKLPHPRLEWLLL